MAKRNSCVQARREEEEVGPRYKTRFEGEKEVCCLVERNAIFVIKESLLEYIVVVIFSIAPVTI